MSNLVEQLFDCWSNAEGAEKLCVKAAEEITRLRAALADAQAVGFAAGVEAAAKAADDRWAVWMETSDKRYEMDYPDAKKDSERAACLADEAYAIATAISALTPPDATAAAARVLLPIMEQQHIDYITSLGRDPGKYTSEYSMVAKSLRAIAGDTP